MPSLRYLNVVLTVLAVLLGLNLWTSWHQTPTGELGLDNPAHAAGLPDAAAQRREIIDQLKLLVNKTGTLADLLKSGEVRIKTDRPEDAK